MADGDYRPDWLSGYASKSLYRWEEHEAESQVFYTRRLGIVESLFDHDGTQHEGRADLNCNLKVELRSIKDAKAIREHISLAWSVLRHQHPLLSAKAVASTKHGNERAFVYRRPGSGKDIVRDGYPHVCYLEDHRKGVDAHDFYQHLMNSSRAIDPELALSKLFVLPYSSSKETSFTVNCVFVVAHQVCDGLTVHRWMSSFVDLLNLSDARLIERAASLASMSPVSSLPPAQEVLYHPVPGSVARQRWFWAIARILRHVKRPMPAAFQNPLNRSQPLQASNRFPTKYEVLSYDRTPALNNYAIAPTLDRRSTEKLVKLCRQAKISIGSGLFTLVALVMMQMEEERHPNIALEDRLPFHGSFPVNPRPFLAGEPTAGKEDSLMLGFGDGVILPFLPKDLSFDGRFRLLGRQAHRQLKQYQKRPRTAEEELSLGSRSPRQLLPSLYMATLERLQNWRSAQPGTYNLQGAYPVAVPLSPATCGISSVGDRTQIIAPGKYDVTHLSTDQDFVADFRDVSSAVRARNGEFLCGAASDREKTYFMISVDSCAVDRGKAKHFKEVIETILEPRDTKSKL
ncbi:uncharacterized protein AB675_7629 [Cyphellophora attinorum]|uniref:Uncharacterized protein n=1 Tax=Cyphellophora attinorum TaxID=1664694 RepID=A0A0N1P0P3_9EURO|nr:uncharacterized protein AB675_7629 [Phialophora attinorum]KPI40352.1 hypothetical protein AB675_7629 [Phialophora attinorum]